jgi:hypothetical protein
MAKKKPTRSKVESSSVLSRIQSGVKKMQRDAETVLSRARKEAIRLSRDQKQALDRAIKEAGRLRGDFEKLVKRTSKDLESRPKQLLAMLEKEVEKRIEPVVQRLVGPSRKEVQSLSRRVRELEQLVKQHSHEETPAAATQPSPPPPDIITPASGI